VLEDNIYPFITKKITVDGHNLSYIDEGKGETVVMVHGNPTWSFYYRNLALQLRDKFRVIVPDHLGCGYSDKPQDYPYRLENHISNLERLLEHVEQPISMVVHDWGGAIGLGYAGRHPDKIKSLVILNTAAFPMKRIPFRIRLCRLPIIGELLVRGLNGFAYPATFMAVANKLAPAVKSAFLAPYGNWHDRIAVHRFVMDIPMDSSHPSWQTLLQVEEGLSQLEDKAMMILWGGQDFCFNDQFYHEWLRRFPSAAKRYFPEAGHYLLEDKHGEIEPLIADFLLKNE